SDRAPDLFGRFLKEGDDHGKGAERVASSRLPIPGSTGPPAAAGMISGLQPIGTPLVCSGCDPRVLAYYAPIFEGFGLEPTSGGGAASDDGPMPFLPGPRSGAPWQRGTSASRRSER